MRDDSERKAVVYSSMPEGMAQRLSQAFTQKTGVKVEMVLEGTSWLLTRLRAERRRPIADVFMGAAGSVPAIVAAKEGLLETYTPEGWQDLPLSESNLALRDEQWRWVGFAFAAMGLVYSEEYTSPVEAPKTWDELADPRWRGELTLWDPSVSGTATLFLVFSLQRLIHNGANEDAAWEYLRGFYKNIKKYAEEGPPAFLVTHGMVKVGVHLDNQYLYYVDAKSYGYEKLRFVLPEGSPVLTNPVCLVAGSSHALQGKMFIDFLLSPEGQAIVGMSFWVRSREGQIHLPQRHPYWARFDGKPAEVTKMAANLDLGYMADNFDKARIHWQNYIED